MGLNKSTGNIDYHYRMFQAFARMHPIEAYYYDTKLFYKFMDEEGYELTESEIDKLIKTTENGNRRKI